MTSSRQTHLREVKGVDLWKPQPEPPKVPDMDPGEWCVDRKPARERVQDDEGVFLL